MYVSEKRWRWMLGFALVMATSLVSIAANGYLVQPRQATRIEELEARQRAIEVRIETIERWKNNMAGKPEGGERR